MMYSGDEYYGDEITSGDTGTEDDYCADCGERLSFDDIQAEDGLCGLCAEIVTNVDLGDA